MQLTIGNWYLFSLDIGYRIENGKGVDCKNKMFFYYNKYRVINEYIIDRIPAIVYINPNDYRIGGFFMLPDGTHAMWIDKYIDTFTTAEAAITYVEINS